MKISSVSKKVLASALSAAMVVAFAPTVAFGAQNSDKVTVSYNLAGGKDLNAGKVDAFDASTQEYTVGSTEVDQAIWGNIYYQTVATGQEPAMDGWTYINETSNTTTAVTVEDGKDLYLTVDYGYEFGTKAGTYPDAETWTQKICSASGAGLTVNVGLAFQAANGDVLATPWYYNAVPVATEANPDIAVYVSEDSTGTTEWTKLGTLGLYGKKGVLNDDSIVLKAPANVKLVSGKNLAGDETGYGFEGWVLGYDENGDGDLDDEKDVKVQNGHVFSGPYDLVADLWQSDIKNGMALTAIAQYDVPALENASFQLNQVDTVDNVKCASVTFDTEVVDFGSALGGGCKVVLTDPDGNAKSKIVDNAGDIDAITVAAKAGTYKVELVDGNGTVLGSKSYQIGAVTLMGGYFTGRDGLTAASQTVFYNADAKTTYGAILSSGNLGALSVTADKDGKTDTTTDRTAKFYTAAGEEVSATSAVEVKAGAKTVEATAWYNDEAVITGFKYEKNKLTVAVASASYATASKAEVADPSSFSSATKYQLVITDAEGNVVADTTETGAKAFDGTFGATTTKTIAGADGTYTATLYEVKGKTPGALSDDSNGSVKAISSKTVTVAAIAAPTWSYTANADVTKGGILVLGNTAGSGYDVYYGTTGASKYIQGETGIEVKPGATTPANITIYTKAQDTKADPATSKQIVLVPYGKTGVLSTFTTFAAQADALRINGAVTDYYGKSQAVKDAVAAAKKTFTDAGYMVQNANNTEWDATIVAAEKTVLQAVAEVAQAEVEKLYAGTTDKDGNLTKISSDNYKKATDAIAKVVADFAANHDGDTANNVAGYKDIDADKNYFKAVDKALAAAAGATVTYKKADVDAAAAVTAQLKDATTAEAGLKAYAELSAAAKELVAGADLAAAQKAVEEAAAAAALVKEQDIAAVKYVNSTKTKTVKLATAKKGTASITYKSKVSASGNAVVYTKVSGAKIKVAASGTVTLKKVAKAGTYTGKVKVTCGDATRTVKVKFFVK